MNNRVLVFPSGSTTPTGVLGQAGSFASCSINIGGSTGSPSSGSLYQPAGVALDGSGAVVVSDSGNNRVLYFPAGFTTSTRVIGQSSFLSNAINAGGISGGTLYYPAGLAVSDSDMLYVCDEYNNRVLLFPAVPAVTCYLLNVTARNATAASISPPSSGGCSVGSYIPNTVVLLNVTCAAHFTFAGWSSWARVLGSNSSLFSVVTGSSNEIFTASCVTAPASPVCSSLTLVINGHGTVITTPNITACGAGSYPIGLPVILDAVPAAGYAATVNLFYGTYDGTYTPLTFIMPATPVTETIDFTCLSLTLSSNNPIQSLVSVTPATSGSGSCPAGFYLTGDFLILSATSTSGYPFAFWNGSISQNIASPLPLTVGTAPLIVRANFICFPLTVLSSDTTRGNVTVSPTSSGGCARGFYAAGTTVVLNVTTAANAFFSSWSGTQTSTANPFTFDIGVSAASEIANFVAKATGLYGQANFTAGLPNMGNASPSGATLWQPSGVGLDSAKNVYSQWTSTVFFFLFSFSDSGLSDCTCM
jgi:hypothetical protein